MSLGQVKARITVCKRVADQGGYLQDAAHELDMLPSTLWHFLKRHKQEALRARLAQPNDMKRMLPLKERNRRLYLSDRLGTKIAAKRLGLSYQALYMWLRNNRPKYTLEP